MTVYTISEVLSQPSKVERCDKFYNPSIEHRGDIDLLRRFSNFASLPMEGASCGLIWWLLHAAGVNGDSCVACHSVALSVGESSVIQLSGTGATTKKPEFREGRETFGYERCLKEKSCAHQRSAASTIMEFSSTCTAVNIARAELESCYIEQSEPLKAFAVALTVWIANQGGKTGWLRPLLFGHFAARQPRHWRSELYQNFKYTMRRDERLKTTVLRPSLDYERGFQWLAVQRIIHQRNRLDCFKASPIGVYAEGHVMRICTSRDREKELYLSAEEISNSLYANRDWRLLDSWSNWIRGRGEYCGFAIPSVSLEKVLFNRPVKLEGMLLSGFHRHDSIWFSPSWGKLRVYREGNILRISHNPFRMREAVNATNDSLFG